MWTVWIAWCARETTECMQTEAGGLSRVPQARSGNTAATRREQELFVQVTTDLVGARRGQHRQQRTGEY